MEPPFVRNRKCHNALAFRVERGDPRSGATVAIGQRESGLRHLPSLLQVALASIHRLPQNVEDHRAIGHIERGEGMVLLRPLARKKAIHVQRQIGHQTIVMCRQVQPSQFGNFP